MQHSVLSADMSKHARIEGASGAVSLPHNTLGKIIRASASRRSAH